MEKGCRDEASHKSGSSWSRWWWILVLLGSWEWREQVGFLWRLSSLIVVDKHGFEDVADLGISSYMFGLTSLDLD